MDLFSHGMGSDSKGAGSRHFEMPGGIHGLLPEAEDAEDDRAADEGRTADEGRKGEEGRKAEEGRDRGACLGVQDSKAERESRQSLWFGEGSEGSS